MLTPMMVQYLVGLCCLRHDPDAVEITLGDMVYDEAAQKTRDVDVTVMFKNDDDSLAAFKAVEVKKEAHPLDVATVEQLCLKFLDMPQITHRSIVSASGYTEAAKLKAKRHSVDLYTLKPWEGQMEDNFPDFKGVGEVSDFLASVSACILRWIRYNAYLIAPEGPESFHWDYSMPVFSVNGKRHGEFTDLNKYIGAVVRRSAEILCKLDPILSMANELMSSVNMFSEYVEGAAFDHSHTIDVRSDAVYLNLQGEIRQITELTIYGQLQWSVRKRNPEFYILENVDTKEIFAGAAVADYGENDGRLFAMIFPETGREIGIHSFCIPEKQKNIIHSLKIKD